jgi:hypothetical protein
LDGIKALLGTVAVPGPGVGGAEDITAFAAFPSCTKDKTWSTNPLKAGQALPVRRFHGSAQPQDRRPEGGSRTSPGVADLYPAALAGFSKSRSPSC